MSAELSLIIVFDDGKLRSRPFDRAFREELLRTRTAWLRTIAGEVTLGPPNVAALSVTARGSQEAIQTLVTELDNHPDISELMFDGPMIRAAMTHTVPASSED